MAQVTKDQVRTMSVKIAENPRTPLGESLGFAWPTGTVQDPLGFELVMHRMASERDGGLSHPMPCPERREISRCIDWDHKFSEVVSPMLCRLHRLARRILRSDDLAEDAVQEALLSLWQEQRVPPNPDGWLVRAVVNRSLHLNRTRKRRRDHEKRAAARRSEHDPAGDASRPLEVAEVAHAIDAALSALPDRLRSVFVFRETKRLGYKTIAEVLQIPVGTVRSRLHRAREALQGALRGAGEV
jgi:RNA polymerase sigma-70 factor (ECF subfamily)